MMESKSEIQPELKSVILTCSCFRMDKKAREAFSLIFPNRVSPDIIKGRDRIYKFAKSINNDHVTAISKLSGRFAYYIQLDGDKIVEEYDLLTKRRIA